MIIKAISLDFWGTLYFGQTCTNTERIKAIHHFLKNKSINKSLVETTNAFMDFYNYSLTYSSTTWKHWYVQDFLFNTFLRLNIPPSSFDDSEIAELIILIEEIGYHNCPPSAFSDVVEGVAALSRDFPLAILSNVGLTTGRVIRRILDDGGLSSSIRCFMFSDEIGLTKPHSDVFRKTAHALNVTTESLLHIGDDVVNDYEGSIKAGAKGLLICRKQITQIELKKDMQGLYITDLRQAPSKILELESKL